MMEVIGIAKDALYSSLYETPTIHFLPIYSNNTVQ